jgi:hypothetical protein
MSGWFSNLPGAREKSGSKQMKWFFVLKLFLNAKSVS